MSGVSVNYTGIVSVRHEKSIFKFTTSLSLQKKLDKLKTPDCVHELISFLNAIGICKT